MTLTDVRRATVASLIGRLVISTAVIAGFAACSRTDATPVLTADMPLHLEDHLDAATFTEISAADLPTTALLDPVEWRFDQPQPDWKASPLWNAPYGAPTLARTGDALRVTLTPQLRVQQPAGALRGTIGVDVPDWDRNDWAEVVVRARADPSSSVDFLRLAFNLRAGRGERGAAPAPPFQFWSEQTPVVRDGAIHTYRLRINVGGGMFQGPWRQLVLWVGSAREPGSIDLLSVTVVPKGATRAPTTVEWRFDEPQPDWQRVLPNPSAKPALQAAQIDRTADALRVTLPEGSRQADNQFHGGVYVDLPGWRPEEWAHVVVRARTTTVTTMMVGLNPRQGAIPPNASQISLGRDGGSTPIVSDGSVQTYQIRPDWGNGPWLRLGLDFRASEPGSIEILSVSVVPIVALYAADRVGSRSIAVAGAYRRSMFTHAPGRLEYRVRVPEGGRLEAALGVLGGAGPVEFIVDARRTNGETTTLLHESHSDPDEWADRSVDVSALAGETITLGLEARAGAGGAVAFWGSPTLGGSPPTDKPNVIFYVIDGGGADYMSVYGYNRRTTPNLEKLAAEGALFEHAYSNSSWTKPSTASFMTSLHNSVLGNTSRGPVDPLPPEAITMAERFHGAGYRTAVFTANSNGGTVSGLQRGADLLRESEFQRDATSSVDLHEAFWNWRDHSPGHPYWVHFQTTDVHAVGSNRLEVRTDVPVPPFAGLFVSPADESTLRQWSRRVQAGGTRITSEAFRTGGISRVEFLTLYQGMYDQQMAHNDYQLGRLIDRLEAAGEWQNTVLIVAADHGIASAFTDTATGMLDPLPAGWSPSDGRPMFRPSIGRVPLIVVWPGHIAGGQRFDDAVSMIDVLPTVLDLAGLPVPDVMQGQSLAPLLLGRPGWQPQPVIFDEFEKDPRTGQLSGLLEVVDGRWGASLEIGPPPDDPDERGPWPLRLYDLWTDPLCITPVNEAHPDLVAKYTTFLEDQWKAHQALATQFTPGAKVALTPEQLERLRALGYIR